MSYNNAHDVWKANHTDQYNLRLKKGGVGDALKKAASDKGIRETAYIRLAVIEKLERDGYLPQNQPQ